MFKKINEIYDKTFNNTELMMSVVQEINEFNNEDDIIKGIKFLHIILFNHVVRQYIDNDIDQLIINDCPFDAMIVAINKCKNDVESPLLTLIKGDIQ